MENPGSFGIVMYKAQCNALSTLLLHLCPLALCFKGKTVEGTDPQHPQI